MLSSCSLCLLCSAYLFPYRLCSIASCYRSFTNRLCELVNCTTLTDSSYWLSHLVWCFANIFSSILNSLGSLFRSHISYLAVILIVVVLVVFVISGCRIELLEKSPIEINSFFSIEERYVLNTPVHSKIAGMYEQTMKLMLFSYDSVYLLYSHRTLIHDLGLV
jgi:magnesium-transporting ATPase (P-type)